MVEPAFDPSKCGFEYIERLESFEFISDCSITESPPPVSECVPTTVLPEPRLEVQPPDGPDGPVGPTGPPGPAGPTGAAPVVTADGDITLTADNIKASVTVESAFDEETLTYYFIWHFEFSYELDAGEGGCCVWWHDGVGVYTLLEGNESCLCGGDNGTVFDSNVELATDCTPCGSSPGNVSIRCLD